MSVKRKFIYFEPDANNGSVREKMSICNNKQKHTIYVFRVLFSVHKNIEKTVIFSDDNTNIELNRIFF